MFHVVFQGKAAEAQIDVIAGLVHHVSDIFLALAVPFPRLTEHNMQ